MRWPAVRSYGVQRGGTHLRPPPFVCKCSLHRIMTSSWARRRSGSRCKLLFAVAPAARSRLAAAVRRSFSCAPMQRTAPDPSVDASSRGPSEREREIGSCRRAARSRSPAARGTCMCRGDVQLHYNRHSLGKYLKLKRQLAERCRAGFLKQNLDAYRPRASSRACIFKVTASWRSSKTASWPPRPKVAG